MSRKIIEQNIIQSMRKEMGIYSYNVNLFRAIPDIRDGLKWVQRRILYTMKNAGMYHNKPYYKVASINGMVLQLHPHGDASVNDALVRMAQDFNNNEVLIDGHGNFGFISGDGAAAPRYIEARLSEYGELFLDDLDVSTVNWRENYDGRLKEPNTLPVKVPNLLINGAIGIAQAYATSIPCHNLSEVIDMTIRIITKPDTSLEYIAEHTFPDFPTGGEICNADELKEAYMNKSLTKSYSARIRGKIDIDKNGDLIISEIPFMKTTGLILDTIQEKVNDKKLEGIQDIIDETNKTNGIKIKIKVKKNYDPEVIKNQLFKLTPMESFFSINLIASKDYSFGPYNIKEIYQEWIDYRRLTLKRLYNYQYSILSKKIHINEGLIKAFSKIDEIIELIKKSKNKQDIIEKLIKKYKLTKLQAENISEMKLYTLSSLNQQSLKEKVKELKEQQINLETILSDDNEIDKIIINELKDIKKKFGKPRKTKINNIKSFSIEDTIADENFNIFLSKNGYIKKVSLDISTQSRGGKGRKSTTKDNDYIIQILSVNSKDQILFFTNKGRVFSTKVYNLPESNLNNIGLQINTYFDLLDGEKVITALSLTDDNLQDENKYLTFVTQKGLIKRTPVNLYKNIFTRGLIALSLNPDDKLIGVKLLENEEIIITTKNGLGIRFNVEEVPISSRVTKGVKGINLKEDKNDEVVSFDYITPESKEIIIVTSNGLGKRFSISDLPVQLRGGVGRLVSKLKDDSFLISSHLINGNENETLIVQSKSKIIKVSVTELPKLLRKTYGNKIIKLNPDDIVTSTAIEQNIE